MIKIIDGNLFDSNTDVIAHQCNCQGVMGTGVAAEVKRRYPDVYQAYRYTYEKHGLRLGQVIVKKTSDNKHIANLLAQEKYGYDGKCYTDYDKLQECFDRTIYFMKMEGLKSIAFPYLMACHRGGGDWNVVYKMIEDTFKDFDVEIWRLNKG